MSLAPTFDTIRRLHRETSNKPLAIYGQSSRAIVGAFEGGEILGFRLVVDPALPPDRLEVRCKGELISTIILPRKD